MSNIEDALVPTQEKGEQTETFETLQASDEQQAITFFNLAKEELRNTNQWNKLCGFLSSGFQLIDKFGNLVIEKAEVGQYIRIDIPGPGTVNGDGYDWVIIEDISNINLNANEDIFYIQARPSAHPLYKDKGIAHFLTKEATTTFMISRKNDLLRATVYGRNEIPNTEISNLRDKIRNGIVGSSGAIGVSKLQWKALVKGILEAVQT